MSIGTILLIILIIALFGGLGTGWYGAPNGGPYIGGGLGIVLVIVVVLLLLGRI